MQSIAVFDTVLVYKWHCVSLTNESLPRMHSLSIFNRSLHFALAVAVLIVSLIRLISAHKCAFGLDLLGSFLILTFLITFIYIQLSPILESYAVPNRYTYFAECRQKLTKPSNLPIVDRIHVSHVSIFIQLHNAFLSLCLVEWHRVSSRLSKPKACPQWELMHSISWSTSYQEDEKRVT